MLNAGSDADPNLTRRVGEDEETWRVDGRIEVDARTLTCVVGAPLLTIIQRAFDIAPRLGAAEYVAVVVDRPVCHTRTWQDMGM